MNSQVISEQNRCAICGERIKGLPNKNRVFPRAICKWTEGYMTSEEREPLKWIESPLNTITVHYACSTCIGYEIPDAASLHISYGKMHKLKCIERELAPMIKFYEEHKQSLLNSQNGHCAGCGCELESGILRRRDPNQPRVWENACIVCSECNRKEASFSAA
ncbi:MAG: hypothetical protein K6A72_09080 [Lachnospiraceae bacterium]|nr:hypothetical protein [Lachnospiraceae bacterium]